MNYLEYDTDFHHIYQSEVYGKRLFKTASWFKRNADKKRKFTLLYLLEEQTLNRFVIFSQKKKYRCKFPFWWAAKGYFDGFVLGVLPWNFSMRLLANGTKNFTTVWCRLKDNCSEKDRAFFTYVLAHEKAIEGFAKAELELIGDSEKRILELLK